MSERLQGVVAHSGVAGDRLQDPDLCGPHVIREVFVVRRGPGEKILKKYLIRVDVALLHMNVNLVMRRKAA